jgi:proliferating cell nuclear antigen PCNA
MTNNDLSKKLLHIDIIHTSDFKLLIDGLKDTLMETNLEICVDSVIPIIKQKNIINEISDSEEENIEEKKKIKKIKKKDSETEISSDSNSKKNKKNKKNKKVNKKGSESDVESDKELNLEPISEKSTVETSESGGHIKILTTDPTKTMLIKVILYGNQFSQFYCKKKVLDIGVNLLELFKLIKNLDKDDTLSLYIYDNDQQNLVIKTSNDTQNSECISKLKLIDINKTNFDIKVEYDTIIVFKTDEFHKMCKELNSIGEIMEIKCTRKKISFSSEGFISSKKRTFYAGKNVKITFIDDKAVEEIVQGIYNLKSFMLFNKYSHISENIQIIMKNSQPICIQYDIAISGVLYFCLSPREDENDEVNSDSDSDQETDYTYIAEI